MSWRRHGHVTLTLSPQKLVEQRGVDRVDMAKIQIRAFLPFFGIHLIDQAIVAVAIVGGKRWLLAWPVEERSHHRRPRIVRIHWRHAKERFDLANHFYSGRERAIDNHGTGTFGCGHHRSESANDQRDATVGV